MSGKRETSKTRAALARAAAVLAPSKIGVTNYKNRHDQAYFLQNASIKTLREQLIAPLLGVPTFNRKLLNLAG